MYAVSLFPSCYAQTADLAVEHNSLAYITGGSPDNTATVHPASRSAMRRLLETTSGTVSIGSATGSDSLCTSVVNALITCQQFVFKMEGALLEVGYTNATEDCSGDPSYFNVTGAC